MTLRLKGEHPKPGAVDRRYYMIDVQKANRRVRLSAATRDKATALRREQLVLDALDKDAEVPHEDLLRIARGDASAARLIARRAGGMTLKEACERCLDDREVWRDLDSRPGYVTNCKTLTDVMGESTPIAAITEEKIKHLITVLERKGLAGATINRKLSALSVILKACHDKYKSITSLPRMPAKLPERGRRLFVFTEAQQEALLAAVLEWDTLPDSKYGGRPRVLDGALAHDLFDYLAQTGLRLGEALQLKPQDVDLVYRRVDIGFRPDFKVKTEESVRRVPLTERAVEIVKTRMRAGTEKLFGGITARRAQDLMEFARKRAGITHKDCCIHAFRHTCATRLLEETGDIALVSKWLGHSDITTTSNHYAHVIDRHLARGAALLDKRASEQVTPEAPYPGPVITHTRVSNGLS